MKKYTEIQMISLTSEKARADVHNGQVLHAIGGEEALLEKVALSNKVLLALGDSYREIE